MPDNIVTIEKTGKIINIPESALRKGDVLLLQAGELVPADLGLTETRGFEVDEFDLTGEIMPAEKRVNGEDAIAYKGSRVIRGNAKGVVIATGEETEYGKISKQRWGKVEYEFPPLIKRKYFAFLFFLLPPLAVSLISYGNIALICVASFAVAISSLLMQNSELFRYVFTSREIKNIRRSNIQLHDETCLEPVSALSVVCFDKTGVLTTRDIEVNHIHFVDKTPDADSFFSEKGILGLTKIACALCNDVIFLEKLGQADPIDKALISFAAKNGVDIKAVGSKYKRIFDKPFDPEDRYMACGFEVDGKKTFFAKGDPEIIQKMCKKYITTSGAEKKLDLNSWSFIYSKTKSLNQKGYRTIALAYSFSNLESPPLHYTFLCLVQLENPAKTGANVVVRALKEIGVRSLVVTGDRPETAMKIAEELGIDEGSNFCLDGKIMVRMDLATLARQSDNVSVYARLLPSQKGLLVMSLQQRNSSVAMVGDGANDAIALKVANVGISFVEHSSPFAKRVSKILINDLPDLLTIIEGAKRVKKQIKHLKFLRYGVLVLMLLAFYAQLLF